MDYQYVENSVDFEWRRLLQQYGLDSAYLSKEMDQKEVNTTFENSQHLETDATESLQLLNHELDLEKNEQFLLHALQFFECHKLLPNPNHVEFLLMLSSELVVEESNFIKLSLEDVFRRVILLSRPSNLASNENIKVRFLDILNGCLLHPSGVKWMAENNYWTDVYSISLQFQVSNNRRILEPSYYFLTTLLEKTIEENQTFCSELLNFLSGPILLSVRQLKSCFTNTIAIYRRTVYDNIRPHALCLVEILEKLLKNASTKVLNFLLKLRVREAADSIAAMSDDAEFSVKMYRIVIILSLFELNEVCDGIKVVNENVLALSGLFRILARELQKSDLSSLLEILHYSIIYSKLESINLPKHYVKDNLADIEGEFMPLQIVACMVVTEFLSSNIFWGLSIQKDIKALMVIKTGNLVFRECSVETIQYAYQLRNKICSGPVEFFVKSLEIALSTTSVYKKENTNHFLLILVFILDFIGQEFRLKARVATYEEQMLVEKLVETIVVLIEKPELDLDISLIYFDIPKAVHNFLYYISWSSSIVVKGLRLLKVLLVRHVCPQMVLLIDSINDSSFGDIGSMVFVKLFSVDWEIRHVALGLVTTIAQITNQSFSSFREILINASLPEVVAVLSIEDGNPLVRAAAFKSLQEIFVIKGIEENLKHDEYTGRFLTVIPRESDCYAKREAVKLLTVIYWHNRDTEHYKHLSNIYQCMEEMALTDKNHLVQKELLNFWKTVEKRHMVACGWSDASFPPLIFCKRIIRMTSEEIGKRLYWVLVELSKSGCLNVINHFCQHSSDLSKEVSESLDEWLESFYDKYHQYEVTEELIKLYEKCSADTSCTMYQPQNMLKSSYEPVYNNSDQILINIEQIENYLPEELMPNFHQKMLEHNKSIKMLLKPSEFVRLVYEKKIKNREKPPLYEDAAYALEY